MDDYRNFREYITDRLEQILRAENAYARFESERSTCFDGEVDIFQFLARLVIHLYYKYNYSSKVYFAATIHFENQIFLETTAYRRPTSLPRR